MNTTKKGFIWIDWISWAVFIAYIFLSYTSSERFNLLLGRSGLFTSCILIILFFNHIDVVQSFKNKEKELIFCVFVGIVAFINMFLAKSGPAVIFDIANFFLILYLSDKIELDDISIGIISITFLFILFFWIKIKDESYNPNTMCLIIFESTMLSSIGFSFLFSKWKKDWIIYPYLVIFSIMLVFPTAKQFEGRTELGALFIVLFFFLVIPKIIWQIKYVYAIFLGIVSVICMVVPAIFTHLYYGYVNQGIAIPNELRVFHGREPVWFQYFNAWKNEPWTGIGNDFISKIPDLRFSSAHNGFLHLLTVYGIFIFLITLIFLGYKIIKIKIKEISLTKKFGLSLIIAMISIASMESYIITSFSNMFLFFILLIIFKEDKKTEL